MRLSVALLVSLWGLTACSPTTPRQVAGVVVDEHGGAVAGARVIVGYHGWAWDPYLVWDHFYATETATDTRGRFQLDLTAPAWLLATVETRETAIRSVSVPATDGLRLVIPAADPACRCWTYVSPMFLTQLPIGGDGALSSTHERHGPRLTSLPHRFRVERAPDDRRAITLTVFGGDSGVWFPDDGVYGGLLDYHPPLDTIAYGSDPASVSLGEAKGVVVVRTANAYLLVELGTGYSTQTSGDGQAVETLLLPARWAEARP